MRRPVGTLKNRMIGPLVIASKSPALANITALYPKVQGSSPQASHVIRSAEIAIIPRGIIIARGGGGKIKAGLGHEGGVEIRECILRL